MEHTKEQVRETAIRIAVKAAEEDTIQSYTSARPFVPHEWVVKAVMAALQVGHIMLGERAAKLLEHLVQPVSEAGHRTAGLLAEALKRIETLERAIPYGPEESLAVVLSNHRQRLDKLDRDTQRAERGAILEVAARVGKLESVTPWERIAKVERVAYETAERTTACAMRLDQLEAGRTGKSPIAFLPSHAVQRHAKAPDTVHPSHLPTIVDHQADAIERLTEDRAQLERLGRWMGNEGPIVGREHRMHRGDGSERIVDAAIATMVDQAAILNTLALVTKQRDEATARLGASNERERARITERDAAEERYRKQLEVTNALRADAEQYITERNRLTVELQSAKESGQRAHDDSTQVRQALATATKERDNAYRAADKAKAQRDGVRSTVVDQARQIGELHAVRRGLESRLAIAEATAKTLTTQATEARGELSRRDADAMSAREQRLRESLGEATQLLEGLAMLCNVQPIGDRKGNAEGVRDRIAALLLDNRKISAECDRLGEIARMADADRVPLRMDLDDALKVKAITAPLVTAATRAAEAYRHEDNAMQLTSPTVSVFAALMTASDDYEKAMAEHLNEIPF